MDNHDLDTATITNMSLLMRTRQLSPVELTKATLDRIASLNPKLHAYTTLTAESALFRARQAEIEISQGIYHGPLHGIPYSLKDLVDTNGIRTTYGYRSHQDHVPSHSATIYDVLEQSGGILMGKVDCHYFRSDPAKCLNPWDLTKSPGMSSSGSGASLAASMCLASIGSDTGGSIRLPAAWCGVVGMKATFGLVSRHNTLAPSWSFDQAGPMAKTVEDVAILLQTVAGYDPNDPVSLWDEIPDYRQGLESGIKGVRIGICEKIIDNWSSTEVKQAVWDSIGVLGDLGAELTNVTIPDLDDMAHAYEVMLKAELSIGLKQAFSAEQLRDIESELQQRIQEGACYTLEQYLDAKRTVAGFSQNVRRVFENVDVIVTPTYQTLPISARSSLTDVCTIEGRSISYRDLILISMPIANVTGLPALSVPCGLAYGHLPVGLQIMGRRLEEGLLLRVGHAYEQATDWHRNHPAICTIR